MFLDAEWAAPLARGTVGLRIRIRRFELKVKLSQDKDAETIDRVISRLLGDGPYAHAELAANMVRARDRGIGYGTGG